ncbi:Gfo/Idh/MocA family oxidoreductase [Marinilongibacter aquaticus]|uniref:Gfo/Idh/MocA family protein n=1 Tax=Marinilongibacter aquaticus TaxID=2975157 RepID=UPI0021BD4A54|nr:Gfo/Idh/MocA family oxidoreductase [Marinilongibacter aquaticus]UBM57331.1 Gfo/Idh/MocA family oxidoreductase [Marinilongibacter aquaticus]
MEHQENRRDFLRKMGAGSLVLPMLNKAVQKPEYTGKPLGIALVGLGYYALNKILPAVDESPFWKLTGIVTGTPSKIPDLQKKYGLKDKNILNYDNYDQLKDCPEIDAVYVCLPNGMHAEYSIRAAQAGKHVITEKPMANTPEECEAMIRAAEENRVKLAVGYRCHFEPFNLKLMEYGREKTFGEIDYIHSMFAWRAGNPEMWRLNKKLAGGGAMLDVGIYCINAARYIKGLEPVAVTAHYSPIRDKEMFKEVEDGISWQMDFPDGSYFTGFTSYSTNVEKLDVRAKNGWIEMSPAFSYGPIKGNTSKGPMNEKVVFHQTYQMNAMGPMFLEGGTVADHCSGYEGLRDMKIIAAIYESANDAGKKVRL